MRSSPKLRDRPDRSEKQLSGKVDKKRPESFLMHFPHAHRGSYFTTYRMGDWKLIYYYLPETPKQPKALLYNLKDDPEERNELLPHIRINAGR